jgi:hypothetical protein
MARQQRCLAQITRRRSIGVVSRVPLELYGGGIQIVNKVSLVVPNGSKLELPAEVMNSSPKPE